MDPADYILHIAVPDSDGTCRRFKTYCGEKIPEDALWKCNPIMLSSEGPFEDMCEACWLTARNQRELHMTHFLLLFPKKEYNQAFFTEQVAEKAIEIDALDTAEEIMRRAGNKGVSLEDLTYPFRTGQPGDGGTDDET